MKKRGHLSHTEQSDKLIHACLHSIHIWLHLWSAIFKKGHMHIVPSKTFLSKIIYSINLKVPRTFTKGSLL